MEEIKTKAPPTPAPPTTASIEELAAAMKKMKDSGIESPEMDLKVGAKPEIKGIYITPLEGFAFKTTRASDNMKIFINMVQHETIDKPAVKKKLDDNGEEVEGINIPMSVGAPRADLDKKDQPCIVYDIIVNPDVIHDAEEDDTGRYRDFICQLAIQSLEQKYKEPLLRKYKLPKLQYYGYLVDINDPTKNKEIPRQYIQDRKNMPKIEEVSAGNTSKKASGNKKKVSIIDPKANIPVQPVVMPDIELDLSVLTMHWCAIDMHYEALSSSSTPPSSSISTAPVEISTAKLLNQVWSNEFVGHCFVSLIPALSATAISTTLLHSHLTPHSPAFDPTTNSSQPLTSAANVIYPMSTKYFGVLPLQLLPYAHTTTCSDYIDPIQPLPTASTFAYFCSIELPASHQGTPIAQYLNDTKITLSPYRMVVKLPGYKEKIIYFSTVIHPLYTTKYIYQPEGYVRKRYLWIVIGIDYDQSVQNENTVDALSSAYTQTLANKVQIQQEDSTNNSKTKRILTIYNHSTPDIGSKPWLLAQALQSDSEEKNIYRDAYDSILVPQVTSTTNIDSEKSGQRANAVDTLPEDRFHLSLPEDVDPYTGLKYDTPPPPASAFQPKPSKSERESTEEQELPEDRFHSKDASSQYLINQREQQRKDKWERYEKEKAERKNDPNVEYIEVDDFKPGGKFGPPPIPVTAETSNAVETSVELKKAASVLADQTNLKVSSAISSTLWTELL